MTEIKETKVKTGEEVGKDDLDSPHAVQVGGAGVQSTRSVLKPPLAYVTLVMKGDAYVCGAIALAQSIRMSGSTVDTVCMVTEDVEKRAALETVFTRVIEVPYINIRTKRMILDRQNEIYGSWMDQSFTKWNSLSLTDYKHVIFLDADMIVVRNIDHLFELGEKHRQGATFSTPWATNFKTRNFRNREIKRGDMREFTIRYPQEHGATVTADSILDEFKRGDGYTFIASLVLLTPSSTDYTDYCSMVKKMEPFGFENFSTHDEQSLAYFYASRGQSFAHIHQQYNFIIHKPAWLKSGEVPSVLHYFDRKKPWLLNESWINQTFNTSKLWWYVFRRWVVEGGADTDIEPLVPLLSDQEIEILRGDDESTWCITISNMDKKYFPWLQSVVEKFAPALGDSGRSASVAP